LKDNQKKIIPYGQHYIDEHDIKAVVDVLKNGWLTQGPKVQEFEQSIAKDVGSLYAVAVSSATAALHLSCLAADLGPGKNAITSANSFVASANCIEYVGAKAFFTDIDSETLNMCVKDLKRRLNLINSISVIIPVHFSGLSCDMESISKIASNNNAIVIEDASHALGGVYPSGERIGSCKFSDMTVFSLHPVKGVTAGEGGVITTNDKSLYKKLIRLRSHGICKGNFDFPGVSLLNDELINRKEAVSDDKLNPWYYEMQELGFNYRITDIQCALALSQLRKLKLFMKRRREIAKIYDNFFNENDLIVLSHQHLRDISANHLFIIRINFNKIGMSRAKFMRSLADKGIGSQVHYVPIPMHPYYTSKGFNILNYPETERYYRESLSIPIFYGLEDESVLYIANTISQLLSNLSLKQ
jgi:perosamine synthetase